MPRYKNVQPSSSDVQKLKETQPHAHATARDSTLKKDQQHVCEPELNNHQF